jgi:hypothetical protein
MKQSKQSAQNQVVLKLNLHREYFAQIAAGTKRMEYRDQTPYWKRRLENRHYDVIQFRNGYATKAPEMQVEFLGMRRIRKWGPAQIRHPAGPHFENQKVETMKRLQAGSGQCPQPILDALIGHHAAGTGDIEREGYFPPP